MKKLKLWLAALVAVVVGMCALAACGSSQAGVYKLSSMTMNGTTVTAGEEFQGVTISPDAVTIELKEDGTAEMKMNLFGMNQTVSGTWKQNADDNKKIDITVDGETQTCECDGNTLKFEQEGTVMTMKK